MRRGMHKKHRRLESISSEVPKEKNNGTKPYAPHINEKLSLPFLTLPDNAPSNNMCEKISGPQQCCTFDRYSSSRSASNRKLTKN